MSNLCFVFASTAEKEPSKLIGKYFSGVTFDIKYLCSGKKDKILKKDIDLDMTELNNYKVICPIGAESLKYTAGLTGIQKYNGVFIEKKYLPIMHPNMTIFKPQLNDDIISAFNKIKPILSDENVGKEIKKDYKFIETQNQLDEYIPQFNHADNLVVDIETTSLRSRLGTIIGIAMSTCEHQGLFISLEVIEKNIDYFKNLFKTKLCIFHNAKFDIQFLEDIMQFSFPRWEDTMLLHYCLEEAVGTHSLKALALRFTDLGDYERELNDYKKLFARKNKIKLADFNYGMLPMEILAPYACKDADATFQLYNKFKPKVDESKEFTQLYTTILKPATEALKTLERTGGPIDIEQLKKLDEDYQIDIEECIAEISQHSVIQRFERLHNKTFNPNSTMQLRQVFFEIMGLKSLKKTATGAASVDKEVLQELNNPLSQAVLDLREKSKMSGTYISNIKQGLDTDGRLRSGFNIQGTTSGRLSSSGNLNYQNIPRDNKDIKKLFKARDGFKIVQCDLGTAEVYYAAVLSGDKFLQQAFIDKLDFHSYVAKQMFNLSCEISDVKQYYPNERQYAKAITFGIMYQAGPAKIAETVNKDIIAGEEISIPQAKQFINKYFREARSLKRFIEKSNRQIENYAFIYSHFGRKRRLPESKSPKKGVATHAVRSGVNFLVQSVASDINLLGVIDLMEWIKKNNYENDILTFTVVHDSIVSEVKEDLIDTYIKSVTRCLQTDRNLSIPNCPIKVDFEVGPSWGELSAYKQVL